MHIFFSVIIQVHILEEVGDQEDLLTNHLLINLPQVAVAG